MQNVFSSSEKLLNPWGRKPFKYENELSRLEIGQSLAVERDLGSLDQLRMKIYRLGLRLKKKFRIIEHDSNGSYEIGRIS